MRTLLLTGVSLVLTSSAIYNAYSHKKQFYPAVIYLTKSSPSMAVLYFQAFVLVYLLGKLLRKIFFGQLRAAEMEHLVERSWYAVTETCLAFTVFRDDFSSRFVAMFTMLLFIKCFHWLAEDRIDYMERSPAISWKFHVRAISLVIFLSLVDVGCVLHAYHSTVQKGASVQLVFGFEYMILLLAVLAVLMRYGLHTVDTHSEAPWEQKAMYMLYVDLVVGVLRLLLYLVFLVLMIRVHTFPLFIIRPVYISVRAFKKAVQDVIFSRRAIRYMNTVFPDATTADLADSDNVCIICREEMAGVPIAPPAAPVGGVAKKLPCGHIFHSTCLRSWFQRQQTCPTCRMDILRPAAPTATPPPAQEGAAAAPAPVANPQNPMFLGQPLPFANWFMHLQQQNQQQQPPAAPATSSTPEATQTPPVFTPPPGIPPFMMPPLGGLPWGMLGASMPPLSPQSLAAMSDDEVRRMEGHSRAAVEARLEALNNMKVLMDAAVTQMAGYMAAVNATATMPAPQPSTTPPATSSTQSANEEKKKSSSSVETLNGAASGSAQRTVSGETEDDLEVIRQRRLQRFYPSSSTTSPAASSSADVDGSTSADTKDTTKDS